MTNPIQAAVNDVLDMLIRMAVTYRNAIEHGIYPADDRVRWPFPTTDDYGDYDAQEVQGGAALALRTRVLRPRPSANAIDEADRMYRVAIRALSKQQLFEIMVEGDEEASDRAKARKAGVTRYKWLRRRQEKAARDVVNFLLINHRGFTNYTETGSVLANVAGRASNDDVAAKSPPSSTPTLPSVAVIAPVPSAQESLAPPPPASIDLDELAIAIARLLGRPAAGETT